MKYSTRINRKLYERVLDIQDKVKTQLLYDATIVADKEEKRINIETISYTAEKVTKDCKCEDDLIVTLTVEYEDE